MEHKAVGACQGPRFGGKIKHHQTHSPRPLVSSMLCQRLCSSCCAGRGEARGARLECPIDPLSCPMLLLPAQDGDQQVPQGLSLATQCRLGEMAGVARAVCSPTSPFHSRSLIQRLLRPPASPARTVCCAPLGMGTLLGWRFLPVFFGSRAWGQQGKGGGNNFFSLFWRRAADG